MEFLRKQAKSITEDFKEASEEVWDSLSDLEGMPDLKNAGPQAGKYALTATLLMCMNYPDISEDIEETFNLTGEGPTGTSGFIDTPLGKYLAANGELSRTRSEQALAAMVPPDPTSTSSIDDLMELLPEFSQLAHGEGTKRGKK